MMELLVILGLLAVGIAIIAIKEDKARQVKELEQVFLLDLPKIEPVKKKAPAKKKPAKKAAKKKTAKKAAPKKAAKKAAKKKPQPKKKKRASVIK